MTGALIGISLETPPGRTVEQHLLDHEALLGHSVDLPHYYHLWDTLQPSPDKQARAAAGQVPLIAWQTKRNNGSTPGWAGIAAGAEDPWIDAQAARFKAAPGRYMLNFENEPELQSTMDRHGTLADYRLAFQRIVQRFRAVGATNVSFVFCAMGIMTANKQSQILQAWPGEQFVDWVGWDPYNWFNTPGRGVPWLDFDPMVEPWYRWATSNLTKNRPYMLAEFGSVEDPADPGRRAAWFKQAADAIEANRYPLLRALCYFDHPRPPGSGEWTLGTGASFDAYRAMTERCRPMAVAATLTLDKTSYLKGETITATYTVTGTAAVVSPVTGAVTVNGQPAPSSAVVTVAPVVAFGAPTAPGLTFVATADPKVWKATA